MRGMGGGVNSSAGQRQNPLHPRHTHRQNSQISKLDLSGTVDWIVVDEIFQVDQEAFEGAFKEAFAAEVARVFDVPLHMIRGRFVPRSVWQARREAYDELYAAIDQGGVGFQAMQDVEEARRS